MSPGAVFVSGALALALVFAFLPGLDLWIAGWFHQKGTGFAGSGPGFARAMELAVDILRWPAIILPILVLARWAIGGPLPAWAPRPSSSAPACWSTWSSRTNGAVRDPVR